MKNQGKAQKLKEDRWEEAWRGRKMPRQQISWVVSKCTGGGEWYDRE